MLKKYSALSIYLHQYNEIKLVAVLNFCFPCSKPGDTCFTVSGSTTQLALFIPLHPPPSVSCSTPPTPIYVTTGLLMCLFHGLTITLRS